MSRWSGYGAEMGSESRSWEEEIFSRIDRCNTPSRTKKTLLLQKVILPSVYLAEGMKHEEEEYILHKYEDRRLNKRTGQFRLDRLIYEVDTVASYKDASFLNLKSTHLQLPSKADLEFTSEMWLSYLNMHLAKALFNNPEIQDCLIFSLGLSRNNEYYLHLRRLIFSIYGEFPCEKTLEKLTIDKLIGELDDPLIPRHEVKRWLGI